MPASQIQVHDLMVFACNLQGLGGKGARLLGLQLGLRVLLTETQALQLRMESALCGGSGHTWDLSLGRLRQG